MYIFISNNIIDIYQYMYKFKESQDRRFLATHLAILFEMIREICKSFRSVKKVKIIIILYKR